MLTIAVVSLALFLVGLLIWLQTRLVDFPPNAELLCNAWNMAAEAPAAACVR